MTTGNRPWRKQPGGLLLHVRLTPNASRDAVEGAGMYGETSILKVKVRAVPEKGKANAALEKLLAKRLGLPAKSVTLQSGGKSRLKTLSIAGPPPELIEKLELLLDEAV